MGARFLHEHIQILRKLGCATCLLGSVLLVLHAPGDKDIQSIDQILHLAIQPGWFFLLYQLKFQVLTYYSLSLLLHSRWDFFLLYDLQSLAATWAVESPRIYLNLLISWIGVRHVSQGLWRRCQAYNCGPQPVYSRFDSCFSISFGCYDFDLDELPKQSNERVSSIVVNPSHFPTRTELFLHLTG